MFCFSVVIDVLTPENTNRQHKVCMAYVKCGSNASGFTHPSNPQ